MKWLLSVLALSVLTSASPIEKRATFNEVANLGYATTGGGTSGGSGGPVTTVTTLAALTAAVAGTAKKVVVISGTITGNVAVRVGANTSVIGLRGSSLVGVGLRVLDVSNVIIRNVKISKVLAEAGDAIGVQNAHQVWLDHLDLSSDLDHDKDFYDGLIDLTHGITGVTVSNSKLYNHWKGSLVGHSDSNGAEDTPITVTYVGNFFNNINSRTPSLRFGHAHIYNNLFDANGDGINTRDAGVVLVENNVWGPGNKKPLYSTDGGFAVARGNDFGGLTNEAPAGNYGTVPYSYSLLAVGSVRGSVTSSTGAGQTLTF